MNEPKKHHFLPQSYQKLFWNENRRKIAELDLATGSVDWFNPKSRCWELHLYTMENEYEGVSKTHLENPFLSEIDGDFPRTIQAINFGNPRSVNREAIAFYVAFLRFRNPWALDLLEIISSENMQRILFDKMRSGKIKIPSGYFMGPENFECAMKNIGRGRLSPGKDALLSLMVMMAANFSNELLDLKWRLFHSATGKFITSDKPVSNVKIEYSRGGLEYFLTPLSAHWMLQFGGGKNSEITFETAEDAEIEEGNIAVASCAYNKILGASKEQLEKIHIQLQ